jgi:hypothetical protein
MDTTTVLIVAAAAAFGIRSHYIKLRKDLRRAAKRNRDWSGKSDAGLAEETCENSRSFVGRAVELFR